MRDFGSLRSPTLEGMKMARAAPTSVIHVLSVCSRVRKLGLLFQGNRRRELAYLAKQTGVQYTRLPMGFLKPLIGGVAYI